MSAPLTVRPVPIQEAFRTVTGASRFLASVAAILVGYGVLTAVQGSAVEGILGAIPGLVALVGDLVRSFQVQRAIGDAEAKVTPSIDPAESVILGGVEVLVPLRKEPF